MIARAAKIASTLTQRYPNGQASHHVRVESAIGDVTLVVDPLEFAMVEQAITAKSRLVLSLTVVGGGE